MDFSSPSENHQKKKVKTSKDLPFSSLLSPSLPFSSLLFPLSFSPPLPIFVDLRLMTNESPSIFSPLLKILRFFSIISLMNTLLRLFHGKDDLSQASQSFYDLKAKTIKNEEMDFGELKGKVVMVVNVASECGRTKRNYEQLEPMYQELKDKGLEILGFPSNQFLGQEPGSSDEICERISNRFKPSFPIMEKVAVNGSDSHPVYVYLKKATNSEPIRWNFEKFVCDRNGNIKRFDGAEPNDFRSEIEEMLEQPLPSQ